MEQKVKELTTPKYNLTKSVLDDRKNLLNYTKLEEQNLNNYGVKFPFYYSFSENVIFITDKKPILEQVYDYLNSQSNYYSKSDFIIVKLIRNYDNISLSLFIYPVISKNSPLGNEVRYKCNGLFDYLNICINEKMEMDNPKYDNFRLKIHSHSDQYFLGFLHYLNCGIFKYDKEGKVNRFKGWDNNFFTQYDISMTKILTKYLNTDDMDEDIEEDFDENIDF